MHGNLKHLLLFSLMLILSWLSSFAQNDIVDGSYAPIIKEIEETDIIKVNIPAALNDCLFPLSATTTEVDSEELENPEKNVTRVGYRVQVFDDNNVRNAKQLAQERKVMIEKRFPEFEAYIQFNSPYWRVKVGDFRTRSEAEAAMGAIRLAFPSISSQLRVVRDKINTRQ